MLRHLTIGFLAVAGHVAVIAGLFAVAPVEPGRRQPAPSSAPKFVRASCATPELSIDFEAIEDVVAAIPSN